MSNWIHSTLEQICVPDKGAIISGPFGSNISSKFFVSQGVPVIRGNNLTLGKEKFIDNGFAYITPEKAEELNCYALKNDLVFTAAGTLGQVGVLTGDLRYEKYVISNKQLRARIDSSKVDLLYAYYWYSSPWMQQYFITNNKGSTVPLVTLSELKSAPITYPESIEEQRKIASIFDDITTKIDLNAQLCAELEAMAKTLYDYWFVQFDFPDENGKPYRTSGGAMEWCQELGREVPKGWKVRRLPEVSSVQYGFPLSTEKFSSTGNRVVRIRDIIDNSYSALTNEAVGNEYFTQEDDLLVGMDGNFQMNYWTRNGDIVNQRITRIRKTVIPIMLIKMQIQPYITAKIDTVARSTVGHLSDADFSERYILVPEGLDIDIFDAYLSKIVSLRKENQELSDLRDWLLPMLMNGQAQVEK